MTAAFNLSTVSLIAFGSIATSVVLVVAIALIVGIILTLAGHFLSVPTNPKVDEIRDVLPGINCGACGYVGCDKYAEAVAGGERTDLCIPGGKLVAATVAEIMGVEAGEGQEKQFARVRCNGSCEHATEKYEYHGMYSCTAAAEIFEGHKSCSYGCLGHGDCVRACPFDAIDIVDGLAVINEEKCTGCTKCVAACPKQLIEMVPAVKRVTVMCRSKDKGAQVRKYCDVGCIGCTKCVKVCPTDAIAMYGPLAYIDPGLCINCNKCVEVCPTNSIHNMDIPVEEIKAAS